MQNFKTFITEEASDADLKKFLKIIATTKKKLDGKPVKENFGQKEVTKIASTLSKMFKNVHTDDNGKTAYNAFREFEKWASNYTGN